MDISRICTETVISAETTFFSELNEYQMNEMLMH